MDHLRDALAFLGEPKTKSTPMSNKLIYRFSSEIAPVEPMRLKVEINCREPFHVLPWCEIPFGMESSWFSGSCMLRTYALDELLGTKLRALYQRKKGRDLFDLDYVLTRVAVSPERILPCFCRYMLFSAWAIPTQKEFLLNLEEKMNSADFLSDSRPILLPSISFDPQTAYTRICDTLLVSLDHYRSQAGGIYH